MRTAKIGPDLRLPKRRPCYYYTLVKQWTKTSSLSIDVIENLDFMNGVNKTILKYTYQISTFETRTSLQKRENGP